MEQFDFSTLIETEKSLFSEVKKDKKKNLVLYNDDVNTFDFVIKTLVDICGHNLVQAEQCTMLVHYKGKCAVKCDSLSKLAPMCKALLNRGLNATIE